MTLNEKLSKVFNRAETNFRITVLTTFGLSVNYSLYSVHFLSGFSPRDVTGGQLTHRPQYNWERYISITYILISKSLMRNDLNQFFRHAMYFISLLILRLVTVQILIVLIFFCLLGFFRPSRELFTHMETSPLPVKGCF